MTEPLSYTMALDISVQDPSPVLEAAAHELVRRRYVASIDGARTLLAGDVPKALTVLIELHDLTAAGVVVLQIESGLSDPNLSQSGPPLPSTLVRPGA